MYPKQPYVPFFHCSILHFQHSGQRLFGVFPPCPELKIAFLPAQFLRLKTKLPAQIAFLLTLPDDFGETAS